MLHIVHDNPSSPPAYGVVRAIEHMANVGFKLLVLPIRLIAIFLYIGYADGAGTA